MHFTFAIILYVCIYQMLQQDATQGLILKQSTAGVNSEFFSLWLIARLRLKIPVCLTVKRIVGFLIFWIQLSMDCLTVNKLALTDMYPNENETFSKTYVLLYLL